jgi:hypothetical protein
MVVVDIPDPEAAVFGLLLHRDLLKPGFVLAEHLGDASDGEDVARGGHAQAASAIC